MHDNRDDPAFPATYSSHRPGITLRQLAALILRVTDSGTARDWQQRRPGRSTLRQLAALILRVTDSGTAWMDEMIVRATERQSEDLTLLPPQPTAVRAKQDYCDQQELRVIAEEVWNHGMPPVRKTPEQVFDFAIRFLAAVVERQEPVAKIVRNATGQIRIVDNEENSFDMSKFIGASFFLHPAPQPTGWQPIETAPKDGTHILVRSLIGSEPPTVCHWFDGGWHLSVNRNGDDSEFQAAFWREI